MFDIGFSSQTTIEKNYMIVSACVFSLPNMFTWKSTPLTPNIFSFSTNANCIVKTTPIIMAKF
jgi:hypothetical protein